MSKILVRSIDFRPPCPFGIKIAPIEIQSPCNGVESVTNLYMYEQMSKSTTGCVVILNYFMSIYLLKKRNKETKTKQNTPPLNPQTKQCKQKETITQLKFFFFHWDETFFKTKQSFSKSDSPFELPSFNVLCLNRVP